MIRINGIFVKVGFKKDPLTNKNQKYIILMVTKNELKKAKSLHQKKYRIQENSFFVEGEKSIKEFLASPLELKVLYSEQLEVFGAIKKGVSITSNELKYISALTHPSGHFAIFSLPEPQNVSFNDFLVGLDSVRDPGNLGTIIRLCDWFGIRDLVCSKDTVDCFNPKVVQSSMGSLSRVGVHYVDFDNFLATCPVPVLGADMHGTSIYETSIPKQGIWVLGNEANGLSEATKKRLSQTLSIPRYGNTQQTESLNVATATAILLSETRRKAASEM